jgi:Domain of unknown function (DUF397)
MEGTSALSWRKSTYSGNNGGNCVEVSDAAHRPSARRYRPGRRGPDHPRRRLAEIHGDDQLGDDSKSGHGPHIGPCPLPSGRTDLRPGGGTTQISGPGIVSSRIGPGYGITLLTAYSA